MDIKTTLILDSSESLSKALSQLDESPAVIITKNGKYCGIIDHRCMTQGLRDPHNVKCETVMIKPPVLLENAGVLDRINAFMLGHFKALPVLDADEKPLGITTRVELIKEMKEASLIPPMNVSEVMSTPVFTIDEDETIGAAKRLMKEKKAHRIVVTRRGMLVGVVSNYDIGAWSDKTNLPGGRKDIRYQENINVEEMKMKSFLRPDVTLVKEGASLDDSVKRMIEKQVSTVLVVAQNKPIGVISAMDIFKKVQDFAAQGVEIQVSGLAQEDMEYFKRIKTKIGGVLDKFSKSFNFRNAAFHVKSNKSTYTANVYFDTDDGHISLRCEKGSLQEAIDELADEMHEILRKKKELRKPKARGIDASRRD